MSLTRFTVAMSVGMMLAGLWSGNAGPMTAPPPGTEEAIRFAHPTGCRPGSIGTYSQMIFTISTRPIRCGNPVHRTSQWGLRASGVRVMTARRLAMIVVGPARATEWAVPMPARRRAMVSVRPGPPDRMGRPDAGPPPRDGDRRPGPRGGMGRPDAGPPPRTKDPEMHDLMTADADIDRQNWRELAWKYRQASPAERDKLKQDLGQLVDKQFDVRQQMRSHQLKILGRRVAATSRGN